jgi:hypothetical protein
VTSINRNPFKVRMNRDGHLVIQSEGSYQLQPNFLSPKDWIYYGQHLYHFLQPSHVFEDEIDPAKLAHICLLREHSDVIWHFFVKAHFNSAYKPPFKMTPAMRKVYMAHAHVLKAQFELCVWIRECRPDRVPFATGSQWFGLIALEHQARIIEEILASTPSDRGHGKKLIQAQRRLIQSLVDGQNPIQVNDEKPVLKLFYDLALELNADGGYANIMRRHWCGGSGSFVTRLRALISLLDRGGDEIRYSFEALDGTVRYQFGRGRGSIIVVKTSAEKVVAVKSSPGADSTP